MSGPHHPLMVCATASRGPGTAKWQIRKQWPPELGTIRLGGRTEPS
jgi:hypothetical protein